MKSTQRQREILDMLKLGDKALSGAFLAEHFGVSRQIIVKDISTLKNQGNKIISTNRGYVLENKGRPSRVFKIFHSDEDVEKELKEARQHQRYGKSEHLLKKRPAGHIYVVFAEFSGFFHSSWRFLSVCFG